MATDTTYKLAEPIRKTCELFKLLAGHELLGLAPAEIAKGLDVAPSWVSVNLPALAEEDDPLGREPGEALWRERFDEAALKVSRTVLGRDFYALYQGRPQAESGALFRREWFKYFRVE